MATHNDSPINKDKIAEAQITKILNAGSYKIYAEAHGWHGQIDTSKEISINVNNLSTINATTTPATSQ